MRALLVGLVVLSVGCGTETGGEGGGDTAVGPAQEVDAPERGTAPVAATVATEIASASSEVAVEQPWTCAPVRDFFHGGRYDHEFYFAQLSASADEMYVLKASYSNGRPGIRTYLPDGTVQTVAGFTEMRSHRAGAFGSREAVVVTESFFDGIELDRIA